MRNRILGAIAVVCLVVPCCMVVTTARHSDMVNAQMSTRFHTLATEPAATVAMRQVIELRTQVREIETDLACERLRNLPQDAGKWHTSIIVHPDWKSRPTEKLAMQAVDKEPHLKAIKSQTQFHVLTTDNPIYQRDFAAECPMVPCLVITRANGDVIYKESGPQLGEHVHGLYRAVRTQINRHCPDGKCLPPLKFPDQDVPVKEQIPDTVADVARPDGSVLPAALVICVAVIAGIAFKFRQAAGV